MTIYQNILESKRYMYMYNSLLKCCVNKHVPHISKRQLLLFS